MAVYAHRLLHDVKDRATRKHGDSDGVFGRGRGSLCRLTGRGRKRNLVLDCHIDVTRKTAGAHLVEGIACMCMRVCVYVYVLSAYQLVYTYFKVLLIFIQSYRQPLR